LATVDEAPFRQPLDGHLIETRLRASLARHVRPSSIVMRTADIGTAGESMDAALPLEWLQAEVAKIHWFHRIDLGQGVITPGQDPSPEKLAFIQMPHDLTGWSVLDIGAWDGYFSFAAKQRGASRVVALDSVSWHGEGWGTKAGFELARRVLGSHVEDEEREVLDIDPETLGEFDLVLFLGVLYHMRHPLLALEKVASVTRNQLILETHVDMLGIDRPVLAFYPDRELADDASNWLVPTRRPLRRC
jgi:tRNA (mo5U34)-methyltransferase